MFAIVDVGSRQQKVKVGDVIEIPRTSSKKEITLDKVLMTVSDKDIEVGAPYLKNVKVSCEVIKDLKGEKKIAYKYKKTKSFHWKKGHRDLLTQVKVKEIKTA